MKKIFLVLLLITFALAQSNYASEPTTIIKQKTEVVKVDTSKTTDTSKVVKALTVINDANLDEIKTVPGGLGSKIVWIATVGLFIINIIVRIFPTAASLQWLQLFTLLFKVISKISGWLAKVIPNKKTGGGTHD